MIFTTKQLLPTRVPLSTENGQRFSGRTFQGSYAWTAGTFTMVIFLWGKKALNIPMCQGYSRPLCVCVCFLKCGFLFTNLYKLSKLLGLPAVARQWRVAGGAAAPWRRPVGAETKPTAGRRRGSGHKLLRPPTWIFWA